MAEESSDAGSPESKKPRRRSRRRWIWITLATVVVVLLVLFALLPTIISTAAGTRFALGFVNQPGKLHVSVKDLNVSWLSGQSVTGLDVKMPRRGLEVSIDQLNAPQTSLLPVLFGSRTFGAVTAGDVRIKQTAAPATTQPKAPHAAPSPPAPKPVAAAGLPGKLSVSFSAKKVVYQRPGTAPIVLTNLHTTVDTGNLKQIHLAMRSDMEQAGKAGRIDADVKLNNAFDSQGRAQWQSATVQAKAKASNVPTALLDIFSSRGRNVPALLGPRLDATLDASGPLRRLGATLTAKSAMLEANVKLSQQNGALVASPGSAITWTLTPQGFLALATGKQRASLEKPVTFHLMLQKLRIPNKPQAQTPDLGAASGDLKLTASDVLLRLPDQSRIALGGLQSTVQFPQLSKQVDVHLTASATAAGKTAPLDLSAKVQNPMDTSAAKATLIAKALPVALVDAMMKQHDRLVSTLGPRLDASLTVTRKEPAQVPFSAEVHSAHLNGPLSGVVDLKQRLVTLRTPKPMSLTIAPKTLADWFAYAQPGKPARIALVKPTTVLLNLKHVQAAAKPGPGAMKLDPARTQIAADVNLPAATLVNPKTKQQVDLQDGTIQVTASNLTQTLNLIANLKLAAPLQATAQTPTAPPAAGTIQSKTQITGLVDSSGKIKFADADIRSQDSLAAVPSAAIDALAGGGGQLADLLGARTSAKADVHYHKNHPGEADLTVNSDNVTGQVQAALAANDQMSLQKDAQFKINVTPAVTEAMLRKINPMLGGVRTGSVPMTLTVAKKNFSVPISGFNWSKVSADANLQAGTLTLKPTGLSGIVMGVLSQLKLVENQSTYNLTLSPVNMRIRKGLLSYDKLQLAVAGVQMNFSGHVNLASQKLDLQLALSGTGKANALSGVTLPITGTINKPKIKTKALVDVAVKQGIIQGLKQFGGKDVQKVLPGIEQLLQGGKGQTTQPNGKQQRQQQTQPEQQQKSGNLFQQLLDQFGKKKKDKSNQK